MTNGPIRAQRSTRPAIIEKELSYITVGAFFRVYNALGFGFLESIYAQALEIALRRRGIHVEREYPVKVFFRRSGSRTASHRHACGASNRGRDQVNRTLERRAETTATKLS